MTHRLIFACLLTTLVVCSVAFYPVRAFVSQIRRQLPQSQPDYLWFAMISMGAGMVLACAILILVAHRSTRLLRKLISNIDDIARGELDIVLPSMERSDEIGRMMQALQKIRAGMKMNLSHAAATSAIRQRRESENMIAAQIQQAMLPGKQDATSANARYSISALLQPAPETGGDLYDFFALDRQRHCLVIGEVAGKGLPAALFMMKTIGLVRTLARQTDTPSTLLQEVNHELCMRNPECLFATMLVVIVHWPSGELAYASAGHDTPLLIRNGQARVMELKAGHALGVSEETQFPHIVFSLQDDDMLLLYTTGIVQAKNARDEQFSRSRLLGIIDQERPGTTEEALQFIEQHHAEFTASTEQSDDITLLSMQYHPEGMPRKRQANAWRIRFNGEVSSLLQIKPEISQYLWQYRVEIEAIDDVLLIAEEILNNITRHGNSGASPDIHMELEIVHEKAVMRFTDNSHPFDPRTGIKVPEHSIDAAERPVDGLGLYLVSQLADHMDYRYSNGKNILLITKSVTRKYKL